MPVGNKARLFSGPSRDHRDQNPPPRERSSRALYCSVKSIVDSGALALRTGHSRRGWRNIVLFLSPAKLTEVRGRPGLLPKAVWRSLSKEIAGPNSGFPSM